METIKLTAEQVAEIEAKSSSYGCGADACTVCYPLTYRCYECLEDYAAPVLNGQAAECGACGWTEPATEQPTAEQTELWNRYQTVTKQ